MTNEDDTLISIARKACDELPRDEFRPAAMSIIISRIMQGYDKHGLINEYVPALNYLVEAELRLTRYNMDYDSRHLIDGLRYLVAELTNRINTEGTECLGPKYKEFVHE